MDHNSYCHRCTLNQFSRNEKRNNLFCTEKSEKNVKCEQGNRWVCVFVYMYAQDKAY